MSTTTLAHVNEVPFPAAVLAAAGDRQGGASEVAAMAVDGLLELAGDRARLDAAVAVLLAGQPAMAPMWHLARAAGAPDPAAALRGLRRLLDSEADAAVAVAAGWLADRPGPVRTVSHSSLVDRVLARLGGSGGLKSEAITQAARGHAGPSGSPPVHQGSGGLKSEAATQATGGHAGPSGSPPVNQEPVPTGAGAGLVGADAIGPSALLNAAGTGALAAAVPTLVVTTSLKLVPAAAFERLAAPGFEAVPLSALAAVTLGGELLEPAEAGRRAAALAS